MAVDPNVIWENLTENQSEIAELVGIDGYIRLMKYINGHTIYIPKYSDVIIPNRNKEIVEKFNGHNFKQLAEEYDLTVKSIYNIIPSDIRKLKRRQASEVIGQIIF